MVITDKIFPCKQCGAPVMVSYETTAGDLHRCGSSISVKSESDIPKKPKQIKLKDNEFLKRKIMKKSYPK